MAFGINRVELKAWKENIKSGEISFLTHYWLDDRFPGCDTVTKVGCGDIDRLIAWGKEYGLNKNWIHERRHFPHFDLFGEIQVKVLFNEGKLDHIKKFKL